MLLALLRDHTSMSVAIMRVVKTMLRVYAYDLNVLEDGDWLALENLVVDWVSRHVKKLFILSLESDC